MTNTPKTFDLDASIREAMGGEPTVKIRERTYTLPIELPADCFTPFLDPAVDLPAILAEVADFSTSAEGWPQFVARVMRERPGFLRNTIGACNTAAATLFGDDQWPEVRASRPGVMTYALLIRWIFDTYGVGLGEAFGSSRRPEIGGETSKGTSSGTTESTPATSGGTPATPGSWEPDAS